MNPIDLTFDNLLILHKQQFKQKRKVSGKNITVERIISSIRNMDREINIKKRHTLVSNWVGHQNSIIIIPLILKVQLKKKTVYYETYINLADKVNFEIFEQFVTQTIKMKEMLLIVWGSKTDESKKQIIKIPLISPNWKIYKQNLKKFKEAKQTWSQDEFNTILNKLRSNFKTTENLFKKLQSS